MLRELEIVKPDVERLGSKKKLLRCTTEDVLDATVREENFFNEVC